MCFKRPVWAMQACEEDISGRHGMKFGASGCDLYLLKRSLEYRNYHYTVLMLILRNFCCYGL
jgi:hypothetical protein